jgi:hypothetical protein
MEKNICKLPPGAWDSHVHIVDVCILLNGNSFNFHADEC